MRWYNLSIAKGQRLRWSLGIQKFHPALYCACNFLSMLELNLISVFRWSATANGYAVAWPYDHHWRCSEWNPITVTSWWAQGRLKSPASLLFAQSFVRAQIKENNNDSRHWPQWGVFTSDRWFPSQRASNAEDVSIWWRHHCPACRTYLNARRSWDVVICPIYMCLTVYEFSFILFDLRLFITLLNFILNYVLLVKFWIFTYYKIWNMLIIYCLIVNFRGYFDLIDISVIVFIDNL